MEESNMYEQILDKIKNGATKAKDNAEKLAKEAAKRTSKALTHTKLAFAANEANNKVNDIYEEIGKTIYSAYLDGKETDESLKPSLEQLDKLMEEIEMINAKIAELKNSLRCPECGAYNSTDADFCSKCGSPLDTTQEAEEETEDTPEQAEDDDVEYEVEIGDEDVIVINPKKPEE
jgi:ribosomal protein L40E